MADAEALAAVQAQLDAETPAPVQARTDAPAAENERQPEPIATAVAPRVYSVKGTTNDVTTCEQCGRDELRATVVLQPLDADGNPDGDPAHFGTSCAAAAAEWTQREVTHRITAAKREAKATAVAAARAAFWKARHEETAAFSRWLKETYPTGRPAAEYGVAVLWAEFRAARDAAKTADVATEAEPAEVWEGEGGAVPGVDTPRGPETGPVAARLGPVPGPGGADLAAAGGAAAVDVAPDAEAGGCVRGEGSAPVGEGANSEELDARTSQQGVPAPSPVAAAVAVMPIDWANRPDGPFENVSPPRTSRALVIPLLSAPAVTGGTNPPVRSFLKPVGLSGR